MENASKALMMAASVLIAIIIIGVLVKTGGIVSSYQKSKLSEEEQKQLLEFNEQYTKYLDEYVYGTEIITLINKVNEKSDNIIIKVFFDEDNPFVYTITRIKIMGDIDTRTETATEISFGEDESIAYLTYESLENNVSSIRNRIFKCTKVEFTDGKVSKIEFTEK